MNLLNALFLVIFSGVLTSGYPSVRISNGTDATDGEFPFAVSFRYFNSHNCGGSIIGEKWVLTAAHCVHLDFIDVATVLFGTKDVQNGQFVPGFTNNIKQAIIHENYEDFDGHINDIALLEVQDPFNFTEFVQPVELPSQTPKEADNTDLVGWGYTEVGGKVMPVLQKVKIDIYPDDVCQQYHSTNYSLVSHICAGGNGKGQCSGDSGGPLTLSGTQYGIVSWSIKPCASSPGVLTRVSSFRDWIYEKTGI